MSVLLLFQRTMDPILSGLCGVQCYLIKPIDHRLDMRRLYAKTALIQSIVLRHFNLSLPLHLVCGWILQCHTSYHLEKKSPLFLHLVPCSEQLCTIFFPGQEYTVCVLAALLLRAFSFISFILYFYV